MEYSLRRGVHLLKDDFEKLCTDAKAPVTLLPGQKPTIVSYATALVNWVFRKESDHIRQHILEMLLGPRSKNAIGARKGSKVLEALEHINAEDW